MSHQTWHVAVLIPARDEEELLPRCLRSVQAAVHRLPAYVTCDVVLVSDCSSDGTVDVAERLLRGAGQVLRSSAGLVGCARALAAKVALGRSLVMPERTWLANTDADCEVPEDWLLKQLAAAERGVAAVAGVVDVDTFEEHDAGVEHMFRMTYRTHPDGTHPHVHGANLGVRADAYVQAGGWSELGTAEDHDLWRRLRRLGVEVRSDASLLVLTSGRRQGRAPAGFADALAAHNGAVA